MSDEKFVSVGSIKSNKMDHSFMDENDNLNDNLNDLYEDGIQIFQMQGKKNTSCGIIKAVGIMKELNDILIKEFNIPTFIGSSEEHYKCFMISKIYDMKTLEQLNDTGIIQMIKINICFDDKPIASLCYNFNTSSHLLYSLDYISKELHGFYSITLHFKENNNPKYINLDIQKTFPGNDQIMIDLTKWLLDDKTQSILNKLI